MTGFDNVDNYSSVGHVDLDRRGMGPSYRAFLIGAAVVALLLLLFFLIVVAAITIAYRCDGGQNGTRRTSRCGMEG